MKKKYYNISISSLVVFFLPALAFAQTAAPTDLKGVMQIILNYIGYSIPFLFSLALVVFIWGIVNYFFIHDKRAEGAQLILFGIIGFFVMFSVWGLVNIFLGTFGFSSGLPQIKTINGGTFNTVGTAPGQSAPVFQTVGTAPGSGTIQPYNPNNLGGYNIGNQPSSGRTFDASMHL